jgi:CheY-like chemotaxis protein
LLDGMMPEMDGLATARHIQALGLQPAPRLIMLSSASTQDSALYQQAGICCHIAKPVLQSELQETILQALGAPCLPPAGIPQPDCNATASAAGAGGGGQCGQPATGAQSAAALGPSATLAEDGRQALECLARQQFDLVLMDMQMPVMGGLEATRRFRQQEAPGSTCPSLP